MIAMEGGGGALNATTKEAQSDTILSPASTRPTMRRWTSSTYRPSAGNGTT